MPTPQQLIADPQFGALSPEDKAVVLSKFDPQFAALSPADQAHVVSRLPLSIAQKASQHLQGIAAGTDIPPGGMAPAGNDPLNYFHPDTTPTDAQGKPLPMGGTDPTSIDRIKQTGLSAAQMIAAVGSQRPDLIAQHVVIPAVQGAQSEADKAVAAAERPGVGGKIEAAGHVLAAALPGIGPAAAQPAEDLAAGNLGGAAGGAAALAAPAAIGAVGGDAVDALRSGAGAAADASATAAENIAHANRMKLLDPEGKFPVQADAISRDMARRGIDITDPKAHAQAAADQVQNAAEAQGLSVTGNKFQDMADALPDAKPLNAGGRLKTAAVQAALGTIPNPVAHYLGGGTAAVTVGKLARDFIQTGGIRKWGANTAASFARAMRSSDIGGMAKAASSGDQAAAGISDPAYGAVAHLSPADLAALYSGATALYVDPSGKATPLDLSEAH